MFTLLPFKTTTGLRRVLLICLCLLSIIKLPSVVTAPLEKGVTMDLTQPPKWINPCDELDMDLPSFNSNGGGGGGNHQQASSSLSSTQQYPTVIDSTDIDNIQTSANIALAHAKGFRDKYIKHCFHVDFDTHHQSWKSDGYDDWLPKINKSLGEKTSDDILNNIEFNMWLKDVYKHMQTFAVGLEQVAHDMERLNAEFTHEFHKMFYQNKATLCEIKSVLDSRSVQRHPDVLRDIMSDKYRQLKSVTDCNLRDWVIYRDYTNLLEYIVHVCEYLKQQQ